MRGGGEGDEREFLGTMEMLHLLPHPNRSAGWPAEPICAPKGRRRARGRPHPGGLLIPLDDL